MTSKLAKAKKPSRNKYIEEITGAYRHAFTLKHLRTFNDVFGPIVPSATDIKKSRIYQLLMKDCLP